MKKLVLETTAPFQGLPELVAYKEGLFEKEGIQIEWVERDTEQKERADVNVSSPKGLNPFSSHGKMLEQGKADMYNACEWGNYCRVQDTKVCSRQPRPARASSPSQRPLDKGARRTRRCSRRNSSPARRSACRSISAPTISRCICLRASCRAT